MAAHLITLDPDLEQRLERAAKREVRSPEFLLRDAVELYLREHGEILDEVGRIANNQASCESYDGPTVTRAQFLKEVDESLEHYQRTGLHLTFDEVDAWLEKLQRGEDAQLPECHT